MPDLDHTAEFDSLSKDLIELASKFVVDLGGFAPFGGCINPDGEIVHLGVDDNVEDPAEAIELLAAQILEFGSDVGMIMVDTRITDPRTGNKSDCIMFIGETRRGISIRGFLPYAKTGDEVTFADNFTTTENPRVIFT